MDRGKSPHIDLKWSLTLRVVAVALLCLFLAAALSLTRTYDDVRQVNATVARRVAQQLDVELLQIESGQIQLQERESDPELEAGFPYWSQVSEYMQGAGQCARYLDAQGRTVRSTCNGNDWDSDDAPAWFAAFSRLLPAAQIGVARSIVDNGRRLGTVVVTTRQSALTAAVWRRISGLLGLTALVVGAICVLQYAVISQALRPTRDILAGLDRLSRGELSCRLPSFRLNELQRISEVFNALAASLERTMREKKELAARLVDAHEQERLWLAQDLHDELAQRLSAMSAVAASIMTTAETECPALVAEADSLSRISTTVMRSLRATLRALRPPEIDDLGVAASLAGLARDQELAANRELHITLDLDRDLSTLPPMTASHIYRIVQEGLTNINKHANAARARVILKLCGAPRDSSADRHHWLELTIEDDGCRAVRQDMAATSGGLGLIGMRERVAALGGTLEVMALADQGFRLRALIPIESRVAPVQ